MAEKVAWLGSRAVGLAIVFGICWAIWTPVDALQVVVTAIILMIGYAGFQRLRRRDSSEGRT